MLSNNLKTSRKFNSDYYSVMNFQASVTQHPKHHLLIAGTGRAGTSFLVRYLDALGLETHFACHDNASWFEDANAGAEDIPLSIVSQNLPYVVKSPWTYEFIDQLLSDDAITLDAVIVPIRDLAEAASSRLITEARAGAEAAPWTTQLDCPFENWGHTPGGAVFSLNQLDQERILAHSFHKLLHRVVKADIPLILIDFPRHAEDAEYLYSKLAPILPRSMTLELSMAAHKKIAQPKKVRVRTEVEASTSTNNVMDRAALSREIKRLRNDATQVQEEVARFREEATRFREEAEAFPGGGSTFPGRG